MPAPPPAPARKGKPASNYESLTSMLTSPNRPRRGYGSTILGGGSSSETLGG